MHAEVRYDIANIGLLQRLDVSVLAKILQLGRERSHETGKLRSSYHISRAQTPQLKSATAPGRPVWNCCLSL